MTSKSKRWGRWQIGGLAAVTLLAAGAGVWSEMAADGDSAGMTFSGRAFNASWHVTKLDGTEASASIWIDSNVRTEPGAAPTPFAAAFGHEAGWGQSAMAFSARGPVGANQLDVAANLSRADADVTLNGAVTTWNPGAAADWHHSPGTVHTHVALAEMPGAGWHAEGAFEQHALDEPLR